MKSALCNKMRFRDITKYRSFVYNERPKNQHLRLHFVEVSEKQNFDDFTVGNSVAQPGQLEFFLVSITGRTKLSKVKNT